MSNCDQASGQFLGRTVRSTQQRAPRSFQTHAAMLNALFQTVQGSYSGKAGVVPDPVAADETGSKGVLSPSGGINFRTPLSGTSRHVRAGLRTAQFWATDPTHSQSILHEIRKGTEPVRLRPASLDGVWRAGSGRSSRSDATPPPRSGHLSTSMPSFVRQIAPSEGRVLSDTNTSPFARVLLAHSKTAL